MRRVHVYGASLVCLSLMLAACQKQDEAAKPEVIRPVLSTTVKSQSLQIRGFAGKVEPRFQTQLGFRTLGRIVRRDVSVGDLVSNGQEIAALDPLALELAVQAAEASLSSARAQLVNAASTEDRQKALLSKDSSTQATFDEAQQANAAASAAVVRADADLTKAREELGYAVLRSDFDGVVTSLQADVGQTVTAGQLVAVVARPDVREAVVDIPEAVANPIKIGSKFGVSLQTDPTIQTSGVVREIAPQADEATRTRRTRITLEQPPEGFRLGTTVTAYLTTAADPRIRIPATAILDKDGKTFVWLIDEKQATVSTKEVRLEGRTNAEAIVADGLTDGDRIATAGAHSFAEGQKIKLTDGNSL
ncbi:efflux RND transporter periplasmic adaptor subunit [Phyllobacterium myrsinacearum]|uniref:RND family efflux transporter MFP subunit n=1 Tax=Phyllobacterium myrsinacearum TaxID=28101 RepID=A0A839EMS5_9HYPH|nr:efflux RND transporter periplasmic adaptor subunit [Phyllobacterium myrsinacearum]MBA8880142.1 RND family efflux transporter MFP subunit [Phyllobacterium myrsinacearum]